MNKANPDDLIWLALRFVKPAEACGDEWCELPTGLARVLVEMAKSAPRPRRGRPSVPGRVKVQDSMTAHLARSYKAKLLAAAKVEGRPLTADDATWQAAAWAKDRTRSRLSATEIRERMQRRSRR